MSDHIIDEQGHFWWRDTPIPEGWFAPEEHMAGRLTIDSDGTARLELDGLLPHKDRPRGNFSPSSSEDRTPRAIQGILKTTGLHVILLDAVGNGGTFNTDRFSYEKYLATQTLAGKAEPPRNYPDLRFSQVEVNLEGFEEWLDVGSIKVARTSRTLRLTNKRIPDMKFETVAGKMTFRHHLVDSRVGARLTHQVTLREFMSLRWRFSKPLTSEQAIAETSSLQTLFIVFTDTDYPLPWPTVRVARTKLNYTLYFRRIDKSDSAPSWRTCPVRFPQMRDTFGEVFTAWHNGLKTYGAGFYTFASTKRDGGQYLENRFINLMWGLESFHRTKFGDQPKDSTLQTKVEEILQQVAAKHRRWLGGVLRHQGEPSLKERLITQFSALPIELDPALLDAFAKKCTDSRNDLAHFGGNRGKAANTNFLLDLSALTEALSVLYHMTLLREIGIAPDIIRKWMADGPRSYVIKYHLVAAHLLSRDVLKQTDKGSKPDGEGKRPEL
ncbi:HEPN domain-containing protein [Paraburkholderia caribensis]|uniref:ApeA N-terminal domain 1-containing protein n=1 Tax=Paraburkholderia caribensis TaxID=75105 RepID=UPI001CC73B25|nr:HEPN domain-containing protein [Paraburkholderia caribensis]